MQFVGGPPLGGSSMPNVTAGSGKVIKMRGFTPAGTMSVRSGAVANGRFAVKDLGPVPAT
jgi:hypothetical protein